MLWGVSFTDANTGTAVGQGGTILHTTSGGAPWTGQTSGTANFLYGVSFTDANTGTAVGQNGTIVHTTDGGATWTGQTSGTTDFLYSVSFADSNTGIAAGANGTIRGTTTGGITSVQENPHGKRPEHFTLEQNYPNPFNPITSIRFSIFHPGHVNLEIFNLLGEVIATPVSAKLNAGTHNVTWDASGYPSGVYYYRLQTGAFNETRSLVLLK